MARGTGVPRQVVVDVWRHLQARDAHPRPTVKAKLRVTSQDNGSTRLDLMDEIGFWGVTAQDFVDQLAAVDTDTIELHISSPGGDVFDGLAIMNAIADHEAVVNVTVDGIAASAASYIALAGDTVTMNRGSQMMIHDAAGFCFGNAADMGDMVTLLDRISDTVAGIYVDCAGGSVDFWRGLMRAETWFSAAEAVEAGLADVAVGGSKPKEKAAAADDDDVEDRADRFRGHLAAFKYPGRAQAPAPDLHPPAPVAKFDPVAFRAAIREGVTP